MNGSVVRVLVQHEDGLKLQVDFDHEQTALIDPRQIIVAFSQTGSHHETVKSRLKHYNPWVRSRQEQLEADVASAWKVDPFLNDKNFGTNQVHFPKGRVN